MAINYTTLVGAKTTEGSIKNWVNRTDIPATTILTEAEAWIFQHLRVREMVEIATLTFALDAESANLPADFLDPIQYVPYEWGTELPYHHEAKLLTQRDDTGKAYKGLPSRWSVIGIKAYVDVTCVKAFVGQLMYYALPAALSSTSETNFLTTRYPTALRRSCLARAYEHMKDWASMKDEEALALAAIEVANSTNELARRGQHTPAY